MGKTTQGIVIGIGLASIIFAIVGLARGGEFMDSFSGFLIGGSLIVAILYERNKAKKKEE